MPVPTPAEAWESYVTALGRSIQRRRHELGMAQEELAYRAGMSRSALQKLEHGAGRTGKPGNPSLRSVAAVAQVLDIPIGDLTPSSILLI